MIENWIKVEPWRCRCTRILPVVYDDALSVYENLCKLMKIANDLVHDVNLLEQEVENLPNAIQEEVTKQVSALKAELTARMDAIEAQMANLRESILQDVDQKNAEMKAYVDGQVAQMQMDMDSLIAQLNLEISKVNSAMDDLENRINLAISGLQTQINEIMEMLGKEGGYLVNPITGETGEQDQVFKWVYDKLRVPHTLDMREIKVSDLTYGDIADRGLECWEVSVLDRTWIKPDLFNPVTGKKDTIQNILCAIYEKDQTLPNWRYPQLDITTGDIADAEITCYDWRQNQNWLNVEMVKMYRAYSNGTWEGEVFTNVPVDVYSEDNAYVQIPVVTRLVMEKVAHMDCTATDNTGNRYHLTEPYVTVSGGQLSFNIVVPKGLYSKQLALEFSAWIRAQM